MIGNTDWSMAYQHNTEMFFDGKRMIAVPYDFDHSGLVNAFYAKPNPMLKISSVTERVYRGLCKRDPQTFNNMRNLYISKEESILNILNGFKENIEVKEFERLRRRINRQMSDDEQDMSASNIINNSRKMFIILTTALIALTALIAVLIFILKQ